MMMEKGRENDKQKGWNYVTYWEFLEVRNFTNECNEHEICWKLHTLVCMHISTCLCKYGYIYRCFTNGVHSQVTRASPGHARKINYWIPLEWLTRFFLKTDLFAELVVSLVNAKGWFVTLWWCRHWRNYNPTFLISTLMFLFCFLHVSKAMESTAGHGWFSLMLRFS